MNRYFVCLACERKFKAFLREDGTHPHYCPTCRPDFGETLRPGKRAGKPTGAQHYQGALRLVFDPDHSWSTQTHLALSEVKKLAKQGYIAPGSVWRNEKTNAEYLVVTKSVVRIGREQ